MILWGKGYLRKSLSIILLAMVFSLNNVTFNPSKANAMDLPCEECCSSGIMNMMTSMGMMAYDMADFMSGMCQMMPFFGMFCPDLDQMAGEFFSGVLDDPELTLDMMYCADGNSAMLSLMMKVLDENPELMRKMAYIMSLNESEDACHFTEKFTDMALNHDNLANFFFAKIDDNLYESLTYSMLCEDRQTTENVALLMEENAEEQMQPDTRFAQVFMNIGLPDDDSDGNEMSNERLFYSVFGNINAANSFLNGMEKLEPQIMGAFMNYIFLGTQDVPEVTCEWWEEQYYGCEPQAAGQLTHENQQYHNMYALMTGFNENIAPGYDETLPPDPSSDVPANALFGRMMGMMIDGENNVTPYGKSFFSAILSTGDEPHCFVPSIDIMAMMLDMITNQMIPLTFSDLFPLMAELTNPDAPSPREFLTGSGEALNSCETPEPVCSADDLSACTTASLCSDAGLNWCDGACQVASCPVDPVCDSDHLDLCNTTSACTAAGGYWCEGQCNAEDCYVEPECDGNNLDLCDTANECSSAGGYWCDNSCSANDCPVQPECDQNNLDLCDAEGECNNAGGYWCNNSCSADDCPAPVCDANNLDLCITEATCNNAGGSWCNNSCSSDACPTSDVNLAPDARTYASSWYSWDYSAGNINDLNSSTIWSSRSIYSSYYSEYVELDFYSEQSVSRVVIDWHDDYLAGTFSVQIQDRYGRWQEVYSTSSNRSGASVINFSTVSASAVKIEMRNTNKRYYAIREVEIY